MRRVALGLAVLVLLVACADDGPDRSSASSSSTAPSTDTTMSTTTTTGVVPVGAQPATATCPAVPARRAPDPDRPRYRLTADVRLAENAVVGAVEVDFTPDQATDRLVFRLWPNGPRLAGAGARLEAGPVAIDDDPPIPGEQPDPTMLIVPLGRTVAAGDTVTAELPWRLTLPGATSDRVARVGDTVRLASFFPILAWEPGIGWATEPPTAHFAEASTAPVADFDYTVTAPTGLTVVGSGTPDGQGRWHAVGMRDIALAVGDFRMVEGMAAAPTPVRVVVAVDNALGTDASAYLDRVIRSLEDFGARFGPYPWLTFTLSLTPALSGGIEYPGFVLQGPDTFDRTTPHEVGHQWFYALVGNNQGRDPWLDEGLATWAEARFLGNLATVQGRSIPGDARGRVGEPMTYWEGHRPSYYRGVYLQGAQALASVGSPEQIDCALRHYVAAQAFRIARPADLVAALEVVLPDAAAALAPYGVNAG